MSSINLAVVGRPDKIEKLILPKSIKNIVTDIIENKMPKPVLITGTTGVGKTTLSRFISASLQCKNKKNTTDINPCGTCDSCVDIFDNKHSRDYHELNMVTLRSIDEATTVAEGFNKYPFFDKYNINTLDEFQVLKSGQDSLLKPLEDNLISDSKVFILTNEGGKIKPTIKGRCLHIKLPNVSPHEIATNLYNLITDHKIKFYGEPSNEEIAKALLLIASLSNNSIRDSITNLELILSAKTIDSKEIEKLIGGISINSISEIMSMLFNKNPACIDDIEMFIEQEGYDNLLREFLFYLSGLFRCYYGIEPHSNEWVADKIKANYKTIKNVNTIPELIKIVKSATNYQGYGAYKQKSFFIMGLVAFLSKSSNQVKTNKEVANSEEIVDKTTEIKVRKRAKV